MAQRRKGDRVLGPYQDGKWWKLVVVGGGGRQAAGRYATKEAAEAVKATLERKLPPPTEMTVRKAIDDYKKHLEKKGNKPLSRDVTESRLVYFFDADVHRPLTDVTPQRAERLYELLQERVSQRTKRKLSVDAHRNTLAEARTFLKWCGAKERRWLSRNPLDGVEGMGRRRHGKPQLRIDEARRWIAKAHELADEGETGAIAAMCSLLMGMRCSEIVERVVRDLDDEGRLLWIPDSKTEAGRRKLEVPAVLQPYLRVLTQDKLPEALLFGYHVRGWPRQWVQKICQRSKVPQW